jgi:hypothetical protein|tara:strand:- start:4108 stop:4740 length:633 start_codon:yes stop_codon:yes gene_type:complete
MAAAPMVAQLIASRGRTETGPFISNNAVAKPTNAKENSGNTLDTALATPRPSSELDANTKFRTFSSIKVRNRVSRESTPNSPADNSNTDTDPTRRFGVSDCSPLFSDARQTHPPRCPFLPRSTPGSWHRRLDTANRVRITDTDVRGEAKRTPNPAIAARASLVMEMEKMKCYRGRKFARPRLPLSVSVSRHTQESRRARACATLRRTSPP